MSNQCPTPFSVRLCAIAAALVAVFGGCASFSLPSNDSFFKKLRKNDKEQAPQDPFRLAVMWAPDILAGASHTPTRGFGGRIYFYNDRGKPIRVNGDLIVHGFDDKDIGGQQTGRRYRFTKDQLETHCSESDIGLSYSIWIPWDALGGESKRITLVTSFQPASGTRPVQSEAASVILPGQNGESRLAKAPISTGPAPQPTNVPPRAATQVQPVGLETTTIIR
jgi:hypothetical protein